MTPRRATRLVVAKPATDPTLYSSALDQARIEHGFSGAQLAKQAGVDATTAWEIMTRRERHGRVRACHLDTAQQLAAAVGQEWTALFEWRDPARQGDPQRIAQYVTLLDEAQKIRPLLQGAVTIGPLIELLLQMTPEELFAAQRRYQEAASREDKEKADG